MPSPSTLPDFISTVPEPKELELDIRLAVVCEAAVELYPETNETIPLVTPFPALTKNDPPEFSGDILEPAEIVTSPGLSASPDPSEIEPLAALELNPNVVDIDTEPLVPVRLEPLRRSTEPPCPKESPPSRTKELPLTPLATPA